jgi:hypothetical protein
MAGTQLAFGFQKAARVFKELGIDGAGKDLVDALEAANKAGWDSAKMMQVFGMRGGRAALILRDMVPQIKDFEMTLQGAEGEAKKLADVMRGTVSFAFKELKSAIEGIAIEAFTQKQSDLQKSIKNLTQSIRENKDSFISLGTSIVTTTEKLTNLSGAMIRLSEKFPEGAGAVAAGGLIGRILFGKGAGATIAALVALGPVMDMQAKQLGAIEGYGWTDTLKRWGEGFKASAELWEMMIGKRSALTNELEGALPKEEGAEKRIRNLKTGLALIEAQISFAQKLKSITGQSIEAEAKIEDLNKRKVEILEKIAGLQSLIGKREHLLRTERLNVQGEDFDAPIELFGPAVLTAPLPPIEPVIPKSSEVFDIYMRQWRDVENELMEEFKKRDPLKIPLPIEATLLPGTDPIHTLEGMFEKYPLIVDAKLSESEERYNKHFKWLEDYVPGDIKLLKGTEEFFDLGTMLDFDETELEKRLDKSKESWEKHNDYLLKLSERTSNAMEQTFGNFFFDVMQGEMKSFEDYMVGVFDSISRAFADILGQMVADWMKAQLKMESVAAAGGGFGDAWGIISGLLGFGGGGGVSEIAIPKGRWSPKAEGGPVSAGAHYLVGEKGPELFIPKKSGEIVSNKELVNKSELFKSNEKHESLVRDSTEENRLVKELFKQTDTSTNNVTKLDEIFQTDTLKERLGSVSRNTADIFRASGGSVSAGKPYIVGEKGAEMFMSRSVPNKNSIDRPNIFEVKSEGSGATEITNHFFIHAVDAASFQELLDRNPEGVVKQITEAADGGHGGLRQSIRDIIR